MRTVVLTYDAACRPNLRPILGLLGGRIVAEREQALAVCFSPDALANVFCRVVDKLRLPVLVTVVDGPSPVAMAQVSGD